ncbi:hypothetical protein CPB84DRAFT_1770981, partial [Gymnopilus junonius]
DSPPWCFFDARATFPPSSDIASDADIDTDPPDDSDVIEVVRVARRTEQEQDTHSLHAAQPATLKSRASKVFKSLRGSLRSSRPPVSSSRQSLNEQETVRQPRTPTNPFSALCPPPLTSRHSMSSLDHSPPSLETEALPSPPLSPPSDFLSSTSSSLYSPLEQDEARMKASSPTTSSFKANRRRFSMLSLQKLFSFSSPTPAHPIAPSASISSSSSFSSISVPQTPTSEEVNADHLEKEINSTNLPMFSSFDSLFEEKLGAGLQFGVGLGLESSSPAGQQAASEKRSFSSSWSSKRPLRTPHFHPQEQAFHNDSGDTSLEMRLDSLHFDSLSFDADRF